ncbi:MAG TPA: NrfD/PsrC family molybdoenzyme membrane anchor subunit [Geobacteraceae bacterium]
MNPETLAPEWAWYFVAIYFFVGGTAAGAYFIGAMAELFGGAKLHELSRDAFFVALPFLLPTPIFLIADLGRPERFWHLFFSPKEGIPYINLQSPLSVGSWALLLFGLLCLLSFLDNLVADGRLRFAPFARFYNRIPRKTYAALGSVTGVFIAGYTGVLLNVTARPLWAATAPLLGPLFVASGASTGAAAIALLMLWRKRAAGEVFRRLEFFDRLALVTELLLIAAALVLAGRYAVPLVTGFWGFMFWGGTIVAGILVPLGLAWKGRHTEGGGMTTIMLPAVLILFGGALLRIALIQAGQV